MPDSQIDVEALSHELVNGVRVLCLDLGQLSIIGVQTLGVLSVADLVIVEDPLNLLLHVCGNAFIMRRPDCPCQHLVQVQSL